MGFSLAQFDPTSSTSAFGGVVRDVIGAVPGGSAALQVADRQAAIDAENRRRRASGSVGAQPDGAILPGVPRWALYAGAAAVAALVLVLIIRRK